MKNTIKKLNAITHEANAIQTIRDLKLMIKFNERIIKALVNLKAISNFISQFIVNKYRFETIKLKKSQHLLMMNEDKLKTLITKKMIFLFMTIQRHHEKIIFEIVQMITHDLVLSMPWLKLHNSNVNWEKKTLIFEKCDCVIVIQFTHQQWSMINERHELNYRKFSITTKNNFTKRFASTNIKMNQSNQKVKNEKENYAFSKILDKLNKFKGKRRKLLKKLEDLKNILDEYKSWKHLFREEVTIKVLLKYQLWNHEIKLKSRK